MAQTSNKAGRPSVKGPYTIRLLKKLRLEAKLTQIELATKASISQTALSSYEHGYEISDEHGERLLRVLSEALSRDLNIEISVHDLSRESTD